MIFLVHLPLIFMSWMRLKYTSEHLPQYILRLLGTNVARAHVANFPRIHATDAILDGIFQERNIFLWLVL